MKKSILSIMLSVAVALFVPGFAFASDGGENGEILNEFAVENPVVLDCGYYSYTMNDTSADDTIIVKTKDDAEAIEYKIYSIEDPTVVDTVRVDFDSADASVLSVNADTRSTMFYRTQAIKNSNTGKTVVTIEFSTRVDLYESGSFRSFYGANTPALTIKSPITDMELTNTSKSIKSSTGSYPTTSLTYAYATNLRTTTTISNTSSLSSQLIGAGFSVSSSNNAYYYKTVRKTGTIDLY